MISNQRLMLSNAPNVHIEHIEENIKKIKITIRKLDAYLIKDSEEGAKTIFDKSEELHLKAALLATGLWGTSLQSKIYFLDNIIRRNPKTLNMLIRSFFEYLSVLFGSLSKVFDYLDSVQELIDLLLSDVAKIPLGNIKNFISKIPDALKKLEALYNISLRNT